MEDWFENVKQWLNNAGNTWDRIKNHEINLPIQPIGGATTYATQGQYLPTEKTTTSKRVGEAMATAAAPALAVSAGTVGVPATVGGLIGGMAGGVGGGYLGSQGAELLGLDQKTQQMFEDIGGFAGGVIGGGVGNKAGGTIDQLYSTGQLRGLYDAIKYGIYDRAQGLRIYNSIKGINPKIFKYRPYENNKAVDQARNVFRKRGSGQELTDIESRFINDSGWPMHGQQSADGVITEGTENVALGMAGDPTKFTFMTPASYSRNEYQINFDLDGNILHPARQFRMGFTTPRGSKLPKYMVAADKEALANAPSYTFTSADAMGLTIPESMERNGIFNTLLQGNEYIKGNNTWGMSSDATRFFTRQAQQPGKKLVYAGKTGRFNDFGTGPNKVIYDAQSNYENGLISAKEYVDIYNNWAKEFGGRPGHVDFKTGEPVFYHPTVYTE